MSLDVGSIAEQGLLRWQIRRQYERAFRRVSLKKIPRNDEALLTLKGRTFLSSEELPSSVLTVIKSAKLEDQDALSKYASVLHALARKVAQSSKLGVDLIITPF